ncbi:flagellar hook-length control protein FliK [Candidatus Paracaedibacter symbiosus]|uniref:flagellar hook-length control protein FliK n=1 Tax=Candidatus Paracaedibacter symbiosus TaxID=244582 RepID=UPI0005094A3D|nr:flagellar hook-length control protein FliK [Candidatus Paracaedibacter symbiosus]
MPIQSTASHILKPDLPLGKESPSPSVEKQLLENLDLLSGQESFIPPKFGEVLNSFNDIQSKKLPPKDIHEKAQSRRDSSRFGSRQNSHSVSRDSLVRSEKRDKQALSSQEKITSSKEKPVSTSAISRADNGERVGVTDSSSPNFQEVTESRLYIKESDDSLINSSLLDSSLPICLDSFFINDTLQGINEQQNRVFEQQNGVVAGQNIAAMETLTAQTMPGSLTETAVPTVHIEVQSTALYSDPILDEQQLSAVTDLVTSAKSEGELTPEQQIVTAQTELADEKEQRSSMLLADLKKAIDIKGQVETQGDLQSFERETFLRQEDATLLSQPQSRETQATRSSQTQLHVSQQTPPSTVVNAPTVSLSPGGSNNNPGVALGQNPMSMSSQPEAVSTSGVTSRSNLDRVNALTQLKDHFHTMVEKGETHLKVNLLPQHLGRIEITLDILKDTVKSIYINAEKRETMELLARNSKEINEIFQELGLDSNLANMNFSSEQDSHLADDQSLQKADSGAVEESPTEHQDQELENESDPDALVDIKA